VREPDPAHADASARELQFCKMSRVVGNALAAARDHAEGAWERQSSARADGFIAVLTVFP
jgi:hypothetical protein